MSRVSSMPGVSSVVAKTVTLLDDAGILSPSAEARTLVSFALGVEPSRLPLVDEITAEQLRRLDQAVADRISGVPLQHVTGRAYFRTISVRVGPGVFIPRPETEVLAGWAIAQVGPGSRMVELCAGSGAISRAICAESTPVGWAVEASDEAYPYLVENLLDTSVIPVHGDMADTVTGLDGTIDVVVANPPYVPCGQDLPADVRHDPTDALFSGPDGLDAIRVVARVAMALLAPGGVVGCEHGEDQADEARRIFSRAGFESVHTHADLTSRPRFVTARKPAGHGMIES